jgi:hypothetical protein
MCESAFRKSVGGCCYRAGGLKREELVEGQKNCVVMGVMICIYRHGYYYDKLRDDVICCACGTHGGEEICIQVFVWKSWRKELLQDLT